MSEQQAARTVDDLGYGIGRLSEVLEDRAVVAVLLIGFAFVGCVVTGLVNGFPLPGNHDQFSYLLAADTFSSGRLANATHPMWRFFETFHVIHQPTYVSKYPPGQGMVLAFGQRFLGHPAWGVWLSAAILPVAGFWAASAWLPTRWAAVAGFMVLVQLGLTGYWAQSYWGGNVAALGGALLFGTIPRIVDRPNALLGGAFGLALFVLANSRPLEGLIASAIGGTYILSRLRSPTIRRSVATRALPTAAAVVSLGAAATLYYNVRTTGRATLMPYEVHESTYSSSSLLPGRERPQQHYRHDVIRQYHETERAARVRRLDPRGFIELSGLKVVRIGAFYLGLFGLPPLLGLPAWLRRKRQAWLLLFACMGVVGASLFTVGFPHYLAPVAVPIYIIVAASLREVHARRLQRTWGMWIFKVSLLLLVATAIARTALVFIPEPSDTFARQRKATTTKLDDAPGQDLVVVQYGPLHNLDYEWVYNEADIDAAPVVWARDMGESENQDLLAYFRDRTVWLLRAGFSDPRPNQPESSELLPYPRSPIRE